jgi:putative ATP-dependent endonuclease of OLD family
VISVQGKGNLAKWRRLFECFGIPTFVVFDNDAGEDANASRRIDALNAAGIPDADHAAIIAGTDWIVEQRFSVFGTDFECVLREHFTQYADLEDEARASGIEAKPFIARYVADRLTVDDSQGWDKFTAMAAWITALLP